MNSVFSKNNNNIIKKQLPIVECITKENYNVYKEFIKSCTKHYYNHTYRYSSEPINYEVESFFNWLQKDELYIIRSGTRMLGYTVIHENLTIQNSFVTSSFFLHPNVCKLNSVIISLASYILSCLYASSVQATSIGNYYNHTLLFSGFNTIFQNKTITIQNNLYYLITQVTPQNIFSTLEKYYQKEDLLLYQRTLIL